MEDDIRTLHLTTIAKNVFLKLRAAPSGELE